jgi:uncharacterized membrane protein YGL010W
MTLKQYFDHYQKAHRHPANRFFHGLGIPCIILAILILLFTQSRGLGWSLFSLGWLFQFIGHAIEKTWPEFLKNPIYLVIGPLFFLNKLRLFISRGL